MSCWKTRVEGLPQNMYITDLPPFQKHFLCGGKVWKAGNPLHLRIAHFRGLNEENIVGVLRGKSAKNQIVKTFSVYNRSHLKRLRTNRATYQRRNEFIAVTNARDICSVEGVRSSTTPSTQAEC